MFKNIIKDSVLQLMSDFKLIRLSIIQSFSATLTTIWLFFYYVNTFLQEKFQKGLSIGKTASTVVTWVNDHNMMTTIIIVLVIVGFWYLILHPIGQAGVIHYLNDTKEDKSVARALGKGTDNFFVMMELNGLIFSFSINTFIFSVIRLIILDIFANPIIVTLMIIWFVCVMFAAVFWSYTKYIIVIENQPLFESIKRSVSLALGNLRVTFKFAMIEFALVIRFLLNAVIVIGIPFLIVYLAVYLDILDNQIVQYIIWITAIGLLLLVVYINGIIEAFFSTYWYKIFKKILENEEK